MAKQGIGPRTAPAAFSVPRAAEYLDVSEPTVWRLLRDNELTRVKLRGLTRVTQADCDALLARGAGRSAA